MEVKINREIRDYTESMFFGLSMRQFFFSIAAIAVAIVLYFLLKPYVGTETVSWIRSNVRLRPHGVNRTLGKSDVTVYHMSAGVQHY